MLTAGVFKSYALGPATAVNKKVALAPATRLTAIPLTGSTSPSGNGGKPAVNGSTDPTPLCVAASEAPFQQPLPAPVVVQVQLENVMPGGWMSFSGA